MDDNRTRVSVTSADMLGNCRRRRRRGGDSRDRKDRRARVPKTSLLLVVNIVSSCELSERIRVGITEVSSSTEPIRHLPAGCCRRVVVSSMLDCGPGSSTQTGTEPLRVFLVSIAEIDDRLRLSRRGRTQPVGQLVFADDTRIETSCDCQFQCFGDQFTTRCVSES